MKKYYLVFIIICFPLIFCSCTNTGKKIKPIKTESVDFNLDKAKQMIEKGDRILADISLKETVSREEFEQFLAGLKDAYNDYNDVQWEYIFFNNQEVDNENTTTLRLSKDMFYPTLYHKDVEVISAQITNEYYEDANHNFSLLTIKEAYTGQDSELEGWYREYLYQKNTEDEWVFYAFGGQMNFAGEGFSPDYLDLK